MCEIIPIHDSLRHLRQQPMQRLEVSLLPLLHNFPQAACKALAIDYASAEVIAATRLAAFAASYKRPQPCIGPAPAAALPQVTLQVCGVQHTIR